MLAYEELMLHYFRNFSKTEVMELLKELEKYNLTPSEVIHNRAICTVTNPSLVWKTIDDMDRLGESDIFMTHDVKHDNLYKMLYMMRPTSLQQNSLKGY